jgi:ribose transport system ATP-binding protein
MTTAPALLRVEDVSKRYGSVVALESADLTVQPGEIHALLGANGAGKSTLVKILAGVVSADTGRIEVDGDPLDLAGPNDAMRAGIATVFQDPSLIPDLTVEGNLRMTGIDASRVRDWLEQMDLEIDFDLLIKELPLPVLRLLDLARALAHEPRLLVLDEITAALPTDQAEQVFQLMRAWRDRGRSVLFITHRLSEVLRTCDRATILRDGAHVDTLIPGEGGEHRLVEAMLGDVVSKAALVGETHTREDAPVVFEVQDLTSPGDLDGLSFRLRAGEVLGLVALEGQGQDRLFGVLAGDRSFSAGQILVEEERLRLRSPYDAIRQGVVLVPADRQLGLLPQRPVRENLASTLYNRIARWFSLLPDEADRVGNVIDRLAIDTRAHDQAQRLSGGNQQKLVVGRWLTAGFRVLLCHDPTRGIDVGTKDQMYELMRELAAEGVAILYYTSELAEIPLVCDRVLVMYAGKIVHEQPAATADEATLLGAAHGLSETA